MRYTTAQFNENAFLPGEFSEGLSGVVSGVVIALFDMATKAQIPLLFSGCDEIIGSRVNGFSTYVWPSSGITTQPTSGVTQYLYVMRDPTTNRVQKGKFILGGFTDRSSQSSYLGRVWVDAVSGTAGTAYPQGTHARPVNNLADALSIVAAFELPHVIDLRGFIGGVTQNLAGFSIQGVDPDVDGLEFMPGAITSGMTGFNIGIFGHLNGRVVLDRCVIGQVGDTVSGLQGLLNRCGAAGTLQIAAGGEVNGLEVAARSQGLAGATIDFINSSATWLTGDVIGIWSAANMGGGDTLGMTLRGCELTLGPSNVGGVARIGGQGEFINSAAGTAVTDEVLRGTRLNVTVSSRATVSGVWAEIISGYLASSAGRNLYDARRHLTNRRRIVSGSQWVERVYADDETTVIQDADLKDLAGAAISDSNRPAGTLIAERDPV